MLNLQPKIPAAAVLAAALSAAAAGPAQAQTGGPAQALLEQAVVVNLGVFLLETDLKASLDGQSRRNPEVDFDESFGDNLVDARARADLRWRITPAHHLSLGWFDNRFSRSRVLDDPIAWGDYVFEAGSQVALDARYRVAVLAYEYAFLRQPSHEVTASIGVHYTDMRLSLTGAATVTDSAGQVTQVPLASQASSLPAPLPVVGLRAGWVAMPQLFVDAQVQFFKAKSGDVDGYWSDLRASATWMFNRSFGLGLGYNRYFNRIDVSRDSFTGQLKLGYAGLQAFATASF